MKNIEAVIPPTNVQPAMAQLRRLGVGIVTVEPIKVYRSDIHLTMIHRGCPYEQNFTFESKLRFQVADQNAGQAASIVAEAGQR